MIHRLFRVMEMMATPPENRNVVWLDTTTHKLKIYENGEWTIYYPEGCILLSPIDLTEEEKNTIRKNIGVDVIDTKDLADGSVRTEKIADKAVTYSKLAEDAKGVVIEYGSDGRDKVMAKLSAYRKQDRRLGLYVYDVSLGMVPAINQYDNIVRATSVVKSYDDRYVDIYILVFDGTSWSRQSYSQVGKTPADGSVTTLKIADNAITKEKIKDQALPGSKLYNYTITNDQLAYDSIRAYNIVDGAITFDKIADDAINTPKIKDGAVTNDKLAEETINTPKIRNSAITSEKIADSVSITESELNEILNK